MDSLLVALDCLFYCHCWCFLLRCRVFFNFLFECCFSQEGMCQMYCGETTNLIFFFLLLCLTFAKHNINISLAHSCKKNIKDQRSQSNDATHIYIQLKWFQSGSWLNWVTWSKRCRVLYPALMKQTCLQQSTPLPILINLLSLWDTVYFCCLFLYGGFMWYYHM